MITKKKSSNSISYHKFEANCFNLIRLRTRNLKSSAEEFQRFYSASGKPQKCIVSVKPDPCIVSSLPKKYRSCINGDMRFFTLRSSVSYWIPYYLRQKWLGVPVPAKYDDIEKEFDRLAEQELIAITLPDSDLTDGCCDALVIGDLGFVSQEAASDPKLIFTSSGYSIIDDLECVRPFQSIHDPIGFRCSNAEIVNLPAYARGGVEFSGSGFAISQMASAGFTVSIPSLGLDVFSDALPSMGGAFLISPTDVLDDLPRNEKTVDFVIVETAVAGAVFGGVEKRPLAATILRCSASRFGKEALDALERNNSAIFRRLDQARLISGLQCGRCLSKTGR